MITSYINIKDYQNKEINNGTTCIYSSSMQFLKYKQHKIDHFYHV